MKCFVWVVKETDRKERHSREELDFSLHGKEKKPSFFIRQRICSFVQAMKAHLGLQGSLPGYADNDPLSFSRIHLSSAQAKQVR